MRILLADDRVKVRSALQLLLEQESDVQVVGEAGDGSGLLLLAEKEKPDVIMLDWELPGRPIAALLAEVGHLLPAVEVVAMSVHPEARRAAHDAGVASFVSKNAPSEEVLAVLNALRTGRRPPELGLERGYAEPDSHVS